MKNKAIDQLRSILQDKKSGSIMIALNALNFLRKISKEVIDEQSSLFKLIMTERREMSVLFNLGRIGLEMVKSGYSLRYTSNFLVKKLKESLNKSVDNTILATNGYRNFLTISNSEQLRSFFSKIGKKSNVFVFITQEQPEGEELARFLSKIRVNCSLVDLVALKNVLNSIDCLIVGSDSIMKSVFSNRIGTLFLISHMIYTGKPVYAMTVKWKVSACRYLRFFDSKNFDLIPNQLVDLFCTDVGNLSNKNIHHKLEEEISSTSKNMPD